MYTENINFSFKIQLLERITRISSLLNRNKINILRVYTIAVAHTMQSILFVPTFEENGIFMFGVVFYSVNFADRNNSFRQFFIPLEDIVNFT